MKTSRDHFARRMVIICALWGCLWAFLCILLTPSSGLCDNQEKITAPVILTLDDAWRITLERNKDIQKAAEFRNQVMGRYVEERAAALPQASLRATAAKSSDRSQQEFTGFMTQDVGNAAIDISQVIFAWGKVDAAIRAAKFGIATAEDQLRIARQAALKDVSATFYNILFAKELKQIAAQNLEQKIKHLDEATKKHTIGVATDYDVLAAEVDVKNARPDVIKTDNLIATGKDALRFLLGLSDQEIDIKGDLLATITLDPAYEEVLETALKKRPELSDISNRLELYRELLKVVKADDKPRIDLKASGGWNDQKIYLNRGLGAEHMRGKTWSVGLVATYPFFDGLRTKGRVAQAESEVTSRKIEQAKLLDGVSLDVRNAINRVHEANEILQASAGTVTQAERLLFMAEKGYEYGVKTKLEVDDAQLNLVRAKGNLAEARRDHLTSHINLKWAMGILGEENETSVATSRSKSESSVTNP